MPGKTRRFSKAQDTDFKMRIIFVLDTTPDGIEADIDWLKENDMMLRPLTPQKLSRLLGSLVMSGLVKKAKSKSTGRMCYKLVSKMREDGYEVDEEILAQKEWNGLDWELEAAMKERVNIEE